MRDIFVDVVKVQIGYAIAAAAAAIGALGAAGISLKAIFAAIGVNGAIFIAIAAAIVLAIDLIYAMWAPADLVMQDATAFLASDLDALTNANLPLPPIGTSSTPDGIDIRVVPIEKLPNQYRERREYKSDDEDSEYHLTLRYNLSL